MIEPYRLREGSKGRDQAAGIQEYPWKITDAELNSFEEKVKNNLLWFFPGDSMEFH